jgi:hypothetical protein
MSNEYDIFEKCPDGSLIWRQVICGQQNARNRLKEFCRLGPNEFLLMHLSTDTLVASTNTSRLVALWNSPKSHPRSALSCQRASDIQPTGG